MSSPALGGHDFHSCRPALMPAKKRTTNKDVASAIETSKTAAVKPKPDQFEKSVKTAKAVKSVKAAKTEAAPKGKAAAAPAAPKPAARTKTPTAKAPKLSAPVAADITIEAPAPIEASAPIEAMVPSVVEADVMKESAVSTESEVPRARPAISVDDIRRAAFFLSLHRSGPSDPVADWFEAERMLQRAS